MARRIVGKFESVSSPLFGIENVIAKVDTGAFSGALHCTKIRQTKTNKGGNWLRFSPFDHPELEVLAKGYEVGYVKSSNGSKELRYFVETIIKIDEQEYPVSMTLTDRSSMTYPVLLGRKFLEENKFLVDVCKDNRKKKTGRK